MTFNINKYILFYLLFGCTTAIWGQEVDLVKNEFLKNTSYQFQQLKTDSLFNSPQVISIIRLPKKDATAYFFDLAHSPNQLLSTSQFAKTEDAIIAINGGFFNMDKGGSATYLEENDTVFHQNIPLDQEWAIADWAKTGAIIIDKSGQLRLEAAKSPTFYTNSSEETSVLITGPLLIENGKKVDLINTDFVNKRHPRTCVCETPDTFLLLTIDGRKPFAKGMSLLEIQTFLMEQQCIQAINLDGGGSTTMWLKDRGVVNLPSDIFGERKVANALLVKLKID